MKLQSREIKHCIWTGTSTLFEDNKQRPFGESCIFNHPTHLEVQSTYCVDMRLFQANSFPLTWKLKVSTLQMQGHGMQTALSYTAYFTFWAFHFSAKGCTFYLAAKELESGRD